MTPEERRGVLGPRNAAASCLAAVLTAPAVLLHACQAGRLDAVDVAPSTLTDGLLAHYTFDEGAGATVLDHSGNKRDGALTGGVWIADGKFGGALHFDGNTTVTVPNFPDAPPDFSVSVWIRSTDVPDDAGLQTVASTEEVFDAGWQVNISKQPGGALLQGAFWDRAQSLYRYANCTCIVDNTWTHVAFVLDSHLQMFTEYVNGTMERSIPAPGSITPGTASLSMGAWDQAGRMLVGDLDDMVLYGRALAPGEVALLHEGPPPKLP